MQSVVCDVWSVMRRGMYARSVASVMANVRIRLVPVWCDVMRDVGGGSDVGCKHNCEVRRCVMQTRVISVMSVISVI